MMAIGQMSIRQMFAGLYGHTDLELEPSSVAVRCQSITPQEL